VVKNKKAELIMKFKIAGLVVLLPIFLISTSAFAVRYSFTTRATVRETYTDNVFLTDKNTVDDYITDISAGGTLSILARTSGMNLSFDPGYRWYAKGTELDTWRMPATLNIWSQYSRRTRFEIFNRFLRDDDPESDQAVISEEDGQVRAPGDTSARSGRNPYWTNYTTARVDHQLGIDDSVFGQFLYSLRREDDEDGNDNDRYAPSAGLTYWFGPKWGTTVDVTYTRALFDNSPNYHDVAGIFQLMRRFTRHFQLFGRYGYAYRDNDEDVSDYQVHAPSVGLSYDIADDSRFSLGLGYFYQEFKDSDIDTEQGPFVNGDMYKRWNYQKWSASLRGQAGLDRSDFGTERLGLEWFAGIIADARYNFTGNFYGNVSGRYRYSDVIRETREDNRYRVGVGMGWVPTRWMELTLEYNFNKLDSTDPGTENYDENRVWFQVALQPDQPWRW